jgi:uncharacterized protein (DUF1800 family)
VSVLLDEDGEIVTTSRRNLLRAAAVGTAALAAAPTLADSASAAALTPVPLARDPLLHLLRRATYGPTPATLARARTLGKTAWVDEQLNPYRFTDTACLTALTRFPGLNKTGPQLVAAGAAAAQAYAIDVQYGVLTRQFFSTRQLMEMMVEFWSDHFSMKIPSEKTRYAVTDFDRVVLRPRVFGRFADLLQAVIASPAMLGWLDNNTSRKGSPNENLGRELLELYTVGSSSGYTEADVLDAARVLTGWTFRPDTVAFLFRPDWHDTQPVKVMGFTAANATATGGRQVGVDLLNYLARHPATARRIAYKLCVRFVSDTPPAALVDRLAAVYRANDTNLRPVMRALLLSAEFAAAVGTKIRRPGECAAATVRILGGRPSSDSSIAAYHQWFYGLLIAGHAPRCWPEPNGYPDVAGSWVGAAATVGRWNLNQRAAAHLTTGITYPHLMTLFGGRRPATIAAFVDGLSRRILFQTLSATDRAVVFRFLGKNAADPVPSYFLDPAGRLKQVVTLLLDSPYFALR